MSSTLEATTETSTDSHAAAGASPQEVEAFAEKIFGSLVGAFDTAAVNIGHRLGLYQALRDQGPISSVALAAAIDVDARYLREWLEQQTVAGNVACEDPSAPAEERRFWLPPAQREVFTNELGEAYMTPFPNFFMALTGRVDDVVEAFRTGEGVSWEAHGEAARVAQGDANKPMFMGPYAGYLAEVPELKVRLSGGARVAELGCGLGWAAIGIARTYPEVVVDGYDIDGPSIEAARANAQAAGVADRVRFHRVDATASIEAGGYDLVLANECVHDLGDPVSFLNTMKQLAGEDGVVIVMDERVGETFTGEPDPVEQMFYGFSLLCCLPDGKCHNHSAETGTVMRAPTLRRYAIDAGFDSVEVLDGIDNDFFRFYRLHR